MLKVIGELGYKARYMKTDNYFKITNKKDSLEFNLHFILKYGRVEVVMESTDHGTGEVVGGCSP